MTRPLDIASGDITVSTAARSVTIKGAPVPLTNREFNLLLFFLTHADTVFSREELLKYVWRWDFGDLSTVTVHVKRLRSKLGDAHRVQTVWGHGYLWSGGSAAAVAGVRCGDPGGRCPLGAVWAFGA
jgi:two-component system, OmpR family, response regulator ResD